MANETSYSWDGASTSTISSNEYGRINFDSTVDKVETLENGDLVISKGENSLTVTGYYDEETKKIKNDSAELNLNYPTDSVNRLTLDLNNNTITNSYGDTHESLPIADLDKLVQYMKSFDKIYYKFYINGEKARLGSNKTEEFLFDTADDDNITLTELPEDKHSAQYNLTTGNDTLNITGEYGDPYSDVKINLGSGEKTINIKNEAGDNHVSASIGVSGVNNTTKTNINIDRIDDYSTLYSTKNKNETLNVQGYIEGVGNRNLSINLKDLESNKLYINDKVVDYVNDESASRDDSASENGKIYYATQAKNTTIKSGVKDDVILAWGSEENTIVDNGGNNIIKTNTGVGNITVGSNEDDATKYVNKITTASAADVITLKNDTNIVSTGRGNDTINIKGGINTVNAGADNDTINIEGGTNTIVIAYTLSGKAGSDVINGASANDTLKFVEGDYGSNFTDLTFAKSGDDLTITTTDGSITTVKDFFTSESKIDSIVTKEQTDAHSLLSDATINVTVADGETYNSTDYKEIITVTGKATIVDLKDEDTIKFASEAELTYTGDEKDLTISDGTNSVTVSDYFESDDSAFKLQIGDGEAFGIDTVPHSIIERNITISSDYVATDYKENITVVGAAAISGIKSDDSVVFGSEAELKYSTIDKKDLVISDDKNNVTVTVSDYLNNQEESNFSIVQGETSKRASDLDPMTFTWKITPNGLDENHGYTSTKYNEVIEGDKYANVYTAGTADGGAIGNDKLIDFNNKDSIQFSQVAMKMQTGATVKVDFTAATKFEDLTFSRTRDDLVISKDASNDITVENFFTTKNALDKVVTFKGKSSVEGTWAEIGKLFNPANADLSLQTNSIKKDATVNVDLSSESPYAGTAYNEKVTVTGTGKVKGEVSGLSKADTVVLGEDVISYAKDGNKLTIKGNNKTIEVKDFFKKGGDFTFFVHENDEAATDIKAQDINVAMAEKATSYKGSALNEVISSTKNNETFNMGTGKDTIKFDLSKGIGEDVITANKGEKLNLQFFETVITTDNVSSEVPIVIKPENYSIVGKDLVLTFDEIPAVMAGETVVTPAIANKVTIKNAASKDLGADIIVNGKDIYNDPEFTIFTFDEDSVNKKGAITGTAVSDRIDVEDYESPNGVKGVKINSGSGSDKITGSYYNDTINAKSLAGQSATITEYGGSNKITTGKGNDVVTTMNYSSNNINVGAGNNTVTLNSIGTNKVSAGAGNDTIYADQGTNTIKAGNGNNVIGVGGTATWIESENKYKFEANQQPASSVNKITTGKGADSIGIFGGNNTINTGAGSDVVSLYGGSNIVTSKSGKKDKATFNIAGGEYNKVTSGSGVDIFNITGGDRNVINSGAGNDEFYITGGSRNVINGGKGNDIYDLSNFSASANNDSIIVTDTAGSNTFKFADRFNLFFDVKINKNYAKNGKYTVGKEFFFEGTSGTGTSATNYEIDVIAKNSKSMTDIRVGDNKYALNVDGLAQSVASWLGSTSNIYGFNSALDVLKAESALGVDNNNGSLTSVFAAGSDSCYAPMQV